MKVLLAHPGTQHAFTLASQLHQRNLLYEFWTCFALARDGALARALRTFPLRIRRRLDNRVVPDLPSRRLRTLLWLELKAFRQLSRGVEPEKVMLERNQKFQQLVASRSIADVDVIIGFDTSSWLLIHRAKQRGKRFILDQTAAHPQAGRAAWKRALGDFSEWSESAGEALESVLANQRIEHEQAGLIVTASSFTRETLVANGVPQGKIHVNPYGVDLDRFFSTPRSASERPLRFIFVGAISARKGVPLLLSAWKKLQPKDAELWLVGDASKNVRRLIPPLPGLRIVGRKTRAALADLLRLCDVFVFPSYFEGFGLVLLEAIASGLPIIATEASAGPDLIGSTDAGRLIKSGDLEQLIDTMSYFIEHRDELPKLSQSARARAEEFTWTSYGDRWQTILEEVA